MGTWSVLLDAGAFAGAHDACLQEFAGRADPLAGTWELAEVEERWGDWLFFGAADGAAVHYHAAWKALMPQGVRFESNEEGDRRTEAYQRVTQKLYAIGPDGLAREGNNGQPHPNFARTPPPIHAVVAAAPEVEPPASEPVAVAPVVPAAPVSIGAEPIAVAPERVPFDGHPPAELDKLLATDDHWVAYELGGDWCEAGRELSARHPEAAGKAFAWSMRYYDQYSRAWVAHAGASRWDSDGGQETDEVARLSRAVAATESGGPLPEWAEALVAGDWRRALASRGDGAAPPECTTLELILGKARKASGG